MAGTPKHRTAAATVADALAMFDAQQAKMKTKPQRKMTALQVNETSAVDHPAHMHPGWLVAKSQEHTMNPMEQVNEEAQALVGSGAVINKSAGIAWLAKHKPELVLKAQAYQRENPVEKAAEDATPTGAAGEVLAKAQYLFELGQVPTVSAGVVEVLRRFPDLAEQHFNEE